MATAASLFDHHLPSVKQLQCFLAVAQELNFRRAAERLNMTQPPLTRQIKSLEARLNQQLFSRTTHEVCLTEAGRALARKAESILRDLSALQAEPLLNPPRLRIGLTRTLNFERIQPVGARLAQLGARDEIDSPDLTSVQLLQRLTQNRLDMALTGERGSGREENVHYRWLCREPLLLAMPAAHPASQHARVSLEQVSDLPLFWFSRSANPAYYDKCELAFAALAVPLKRVKEPEDSLAMLTHIARGQGIALMPQSMCSFHQPGLCYRPLSEDEAQRLNIDLYVATRRDEVRPAVQQAQRLLCNSAADDAPPPAS